MTDSLSQKKLDHDLSVIFDIMRTQNIIHVVRRNEILTYVGNTEKKLFQFNAHTGEFTEVE